MPLLTLLSPTFFILAGIKIEAGDMTVSLVYLGIGLLGMILGVIECNTKKIK